MIKIDTDSMVEAITLAARHLAEARQHALRRATMNEESYRLDPATARMLRIVLADASNQIDSLRESVRELTA